MHSCQTWICCIFMSLSVGFFCWTVSKLYFYCLTVSTHYSVLLIDPRATIFRFCVKFYPPDPALLQEEYTRLVPFVKNSNLPSSSGVNKIYLAICLILFTSSSLSVDWRIVDCKSSATGLVLGISSSEECLFRSIHSDWTWLVKDLCGLPIHIHVYYLITRPNFPGIAQTSSTGCRLKINNKKHWYFLMYM